MGWKDTRFTVIVILAALPFLVVRTAGAAADLQPETPGVLILHSNQQATPGAIVIEDTLRTVVADLAKRPIGLFSEYLDEEWASLNAYGAEQAEFLRQKYGARNIRVIVAVAP